MSAQHQSRIGDLRWLLLAGVAAALFGCTALDERRLPASAEYPPGQKIALLLPKASVTQTQFVTNAAKAIEAGYESARQNDPKPPQAPRLVNTATPEQPITSLVGAASEYTLVVGPLLKANLNEALKARQGTARPAMLALNKTNAGTQKGLYQFALDPKDEAVTVGKLVARVHGGNPKLGRPAVVYNPGDAWATRLKDAYLAALPDTKPDEIHYRRGKIADLAKDPRIAGAGTIFMVAGREDAAGVVTALKENLARKERHAPIIGTSHLADQAADYADAKGVFFVDAPWVLLDLAAQDEFLERRPIDQAHRKGELGRLYAMGIDAYYLGGQIAAGQSAPTLPEGMTGALRFVGGSSERTLALGRFGLTDNQPVRSGEQELAAAANSETPVARTRTPVAALIATP